jgi:hypothetical protein
VGRGIRLSLEFILSTISLLGQALIRDSQEVARSISVPSPFVVHFGRQCWILLYGLLPLAYVHLLEPMSTACVLGECNCKTASRGLPCTYTSAIQIVVSL